jgi:hypothetical protein
MDEQQHRPNSNKFKAEQAAKQEKKKIDKVIQNGAKTKKKSGFSLFADSFVNKDLPDVKTYLITDVIVPTIKDTIINIVTMALTGRKATSKSRLNVDRVSYREYSRPYQGSTSLTRSETPARLAYSYDDIILDDRRDAEEVLSHMNDVIDEYDAVTVGDLFDMVGISSDYTDNKYGWTNISSARVERTRDGWRLDLPKAKPLN